MSRDPTITDKGHLHTRYIIEDFDAKTGKLVKHQEFEHNCLLNEGITELLKLLATGGATQYDNAHAYTGVGDDATAAVATQTGLQAAANAGTHKLWKGMDATYPQVANQTVTFRSTFTTAEANFHWQEATIVNASDDTGKNLNRKVQDMGTKTSAVSRVITIAITIA